MSRKVMVIGLDGLTLERLQPLVQAGELPTFARLLQSGASGILTSVTNMTTGPTWASFATGCSPSLHGVLHDFHHLADSYALHANRGDDVQQPAFWETAGAAGRQVIVLNVPLTYPARPVNGVLVAGIDAPGEFAPQFTHPPGLFGELRRTMGEYMIDCGLAFYMQNGRLQAGIEAVRRETEGRTRAAEHLLATREWDLFVTVYSLPDVWQHYYWTSPSGSPGATCIADGYRLLDQHLARLLAHLPADGLAILCSDHGFGPLLGTRDLLNGWLAQQGWLHYRPGRAGGVVSRLKAWLMRQMRRRVSFRRRQQLLAAFPALRRRIESNLRIGDIDWLRTRIYAPVDHLELWVNLQGRQPAGSVPLAERNAFCEQVQRALLAWREPAQNRPRLHNVTIHPLGEAAAQNTPHHIPPDLSLAWNPDVVTPGLHPLISGDHLPEGALIVAGKSIAHGALPVHALIDVAPLALTALGVAVPDHMQGRAPELL
ncbi:MAG: alkaline phosphatase family protein [Caldilineaceae bacterium]